MPKQYFLFYGNCQIGAIKDIICEHISKKYVCHLITCWCDCINKNIFTKIIQRADVILTQPIHKNYRDTDYLHTEYIIENSKQGSTIIIIPSLYFNFYYFDLSYRSDKNNKAINEPSDYHYNEIINTYLNGGNIDEYLDKCVNNLDYKTVDELNKLANDSIDELKKREQNIFSYNNIKKCFIINISDFIKSNYKNYLLFYSMNHPTKFTLLHVVYNILDILKINKNLNVEFDPLYIYDRGMLYKCISKVVNFDINDFNPYVYKYNLENIHDIYHKYIKTYDTINLKDIIE